MTDQAALLRAVLDAPADDAPRLVYADWLDERGEAERAEFIRVQCRLAQRPWTSKDMIRSSQLLVARGKAWFNPPGFTSWPQVEWRRGFPRRVDCSTIDFVAHAPTLFAVEPVTGVRLTDQRPVGPITAGPSKGMWFWGARDFRGAGWPLWEAMHPQGLTEHMVTSRNYATREEALTACSAACVRHGRSVASGHTHRITCPACSGEGCATHGHGDTADRCWGAGYIERPGLPPIDLTPDRVKIPSPAA